MSKQHKQTRKRASHTNEVSGKKVKKSGSGESSGDREKSTAENNYLRLCIIAVVLCVAFAFVLLWLKASFAASLVKQQTVVTTGENKSPKKHSQRDDDHDVKSENQKGILSNLFIDFC